MPKNTFTFIDLCAGIGGTRIGFEQACFDAGIKTKCVFTSEVKEHAISVYKDNFPDSKVNGDITKVPPTSIPDFDYLLAGFPCQPFSSAGRGNATERATSRHFRSLKYLKVPYTF